jgi:hypothetical protein
LVEGFGSVLGPFNAGVVEVWHGRNEP